MHVTVVSPERAVFDGAADAVVAPAYDGQVGILPGHAPFLALLGTGVLAVRQGSASSRFTIAGGFLQVVGAGGRRGPDCGRSGRRVLTDRGVALSDVRLLIGTAPVTLPWGGLSYAEADRQCGAGDAWCDVARPRRGAAAGRAGGRPAA